MYYYIPYITSKLIIWIKRTFFNWLIYIFYPTTNILHFIFLLTYILLLFIIVPWSGPWVNQQRAMHFILHMFLYLQLKSKCQSHIESLVKHKHKKSNVYKHLEDDNLQLPTSTSKAKGCNLKHSKHIDGFYFSNAHCLTIRKFVHGKKICPNVQIDRSKWSINQLWILNLMKFKLLNICSSFKETNILIMEI